VALVVTSGDLATLIPATRKAPRRGSKMANDDIHDSKSHRYKTMKERHRLERVRREKLAKKKAKPKVKAKPKPKIKKKKATKKKKK